MLLTMLQLASAVEIFFLGLEAFTRKTWQHEVWFGLWPFVFYGARRYALMRRWAIFVHVN